MVSMMSGTVAFLASSSTVGVEQLQAIERHLENASRAEEVHSFRLKLADCLAVRVSACAKIPSAN